MSWIISRNENQQWLDKLDDEQFEEWFEYEEELYFDVSPISFKQPINDYKSL